MTDPQTRTAALQAAATWRPWSPGQPEEQAMADLFRLADRFAAWITGDDEGDGCPGCGGPHDPATEPWGMCLTCFGQAFDEGDESE